MSSIQRKLQSTPLLFVLLATLWGTSFVAIEVGLESVPPLLFAALRYDVAGLFVLALAFQTRGAWLPRTRSDLVAIGVSGVFLIGVFHALLYLGQGYVSGAIAAIVISLVPLLTAVFDHTLLGERRLTPVGGAGLAFGVVGVGVVADPGSAAVGSTALLGVALVFLAATTFAFGAVATRAVTSPLPTVARQGWAMLLGSVLLHVGSAARGESFAAATWTPSVLAAFAYLVVGSGVVGFLLYFELLDRVGPSDINLVNYLQPVVAAVVSWAVFGAVLGSTAVFGFVIVFAGFSLLKRDALRCLVRSRGRTVDC